MPQTTADKQFEQLLKLHGLKKTKARLSILFVLNSRKSATSQPYLEKLIGKDVDSVTLYRALKSFEEKGIIHKVLDVNGTANYAMCDASCNDHEHNDEHVHFNCTVCFNVYCMDDFKIPEMKMNSGFTAVSANLTIYGTCESCNNISAKLKESIN